MGPVQIGEGAVVDGNVFIRTATARRTSDHGENQAAGRIDPSTTIEPRRAPGGARAGGRRLDDPGRHSDRR